MGLLFILTASECTNQEVVSRPPQSVVPQWARAASVSCLARRKCSVQTLLHALPLCVVKAAVLAAAHFCEPRVMTWSAGQEDTVSHSYFLKNPFAQEFLLGS